MPILLTILGISLLIFIHEFGHFICARMAGVKVHVFSLGFGPRLWGFRRGDTDYRLSFLPLGGYVMVAGDDPTYDRRLLGPNDLCSKGFLARALFYSGGVAMNLLFALIAFPLVFNTGVMFDAPVVGEVSPGGAAWEAGLQRGDKVLEAGGKAMYSFPNFRVEAALANAKRGFAVVYERNGEKVETTVFPRYSAADGLRTMGVTQPYETGPFKLTVFSETSPEYKAGLRTGDVLLKFNGEQVLDLKSWLAAGDAFKQRYREGTTKISLEVRRPLSPDSNVEGAGTTRTIEFEPAVNEKARLIGIGPARTRIVGLRPNEDIQALGFRRGDHIVFVNDKPFRGGDLDLTSETDTLKVLVARGEPEEGKTEIEKIELSATVPAARRAAMVEAIALGATTQFPIVNPTPSSPASRAGIQPGDTIQTINGKPVKTWDDIVSHIQAAGNKELTLSLIRSDGFANAKVTALPSPKLDFSPTVRPLRTLFQTHSVGGAIEAGCVASLDFIKQIYVTLRRLFTGDVSAKNLGGIITISRVSYAYAQEGLTRLFYFLAILSINLAVINVLPIPVLDGGHLTFPLIEKIKGSPVNTKVHNYSQILGVVFVLALMVYVTFNDIVRWIG